MFAFDSTALKAARIAPRLPWLAVCAAAAFAFAGERHAAASCGDYVMVGDHSSHLHGATPDNSVPWTPTGVCRGPNCHQQAPVPLGPSRGLPVVRSIERACQLMTGDPPGIAVAWLTSGSRNGPRDGYQFRIEHPPRHGA